MVVQKTHLRLCRKSSPSAERPYCLAVPTLAAAVAVVARPLQDHYSSSEDKPYCLVVSKTAAGAAAAAAVAAAVAAADFAKPLHL